MEEELENNLHTASGVYVEAPAGHGKTYIILNTIQRHPFSRQLVLTHTIAGVAALKTQMTKRSLTDENVSLNTIAGWTQKFVRSYPALSGVTIENLDSLSASSRTTGSYWDEITDGFLRLISKENIQDILKASYDGVYVDEYQDCSISQHKLIVELSKILPVRVMGDPLQGIFDFNDQMIPWEQVGTDFEHLATLSTPYRWLNAGNPEYGEWLLQVRDDLKNNRPINLSKAPSCVSFEIMGISAAEDQRKILNKAKEKLPDKQSRLIIGDKMNMTSKALVKNLSRPRYTLIESLDSKDVKELMNFAANIDEIGRDQRLEYVEILSRCYTGLSQIKAAAEKLRTDDRYNPTEKIFVALKAIRDDFNPETALRILRAIENHAGTSCHRRQLFTIVEMSLANKIAGSYETLSKSMIASIESIRQRGRKLPKYSIGSTLLVKGLEVEEVILLDASSLKKQDLYVALSRPTKRITIFARNAILTPK